MSFTLNQISTYADPFVMILFNGVDVPKMGQVEATLNATLGKVLDGPVDLGRIRNLVGRARERALSGLESSSKFVVDPAILNLVAGRRDGSDWDGFFDDDLGYFGNKSEEYWKAAVRETFSGPRVQVDMNNNCSSDLGWS